MPPTSSCHNLTAVRYQVGIATPVTVLLNTSGAYTGYYTIAGTEITDDITVTATYSDITYVFYNNNASPHPDYVTIPPITSVACQTQLNFTVTGTESDREIESASYRIGLTGT